MSTGDNLKNYNIRHVRKGLGERYKLGSISVRRRRREECQSARPPASPPALSPPTTPPRGSSASAFDSATTISQGQDRERDLFLVTSEMWRSVSPVPALEMERLMKDGIR